MDPVSIASLVIAAASAGSAMVTILMAQRRKKGSREQADLDEKDKVIRKVLDAEERVRYAEYFRAREQGVKKTEKLIVEAVDAIREPAPFDPLDPNTDKGWCAPCDGLYPVTDMKFPPNTLLWLCPDCYTDYVDPEAVLNPPKPSVEESMREKLRKAAPGEEVTSWEMKDGQVIITPEEQRQIADIKARVAAKVAELQAGLGQSPNFQCHVCEGQFTSTTPVPAGPVLCKGCVAKAREGDCHYCERPLLTRIFGIYDDHFTCDGCMKKMNQPVPPSGPALAPEDELAKKRRLRLKKFPTISDRDTYQLKRNTDA